MNELDAVGILVQAGAVGISIFLIWLIRYLVKTFNDTVANHLKHSTDVLEKVADSNIQIAGRLQGMTDSIINLNKTAERRFTSISKKMKNAK